MTIHQQLFSLLLCYVVYRHALCDEDEFYPEIFDQRRKLDDVLFSDGSKSGFKPLVLLPGRMECCGKKVVVRYV